MEKAQVKAVEGEDYEEKVVASRRAMPNVPSE
jgi:hypothetical protein